MKYGAVAQMGERLPCTEEVAGSSPVSSTKRVVSQLGELSSALQGFGSSPLQPYKCVGIRVVKETDCKPVIREFDSHPTLEEGIL